MYLRDIAYIEDKLNGWESTGVNLTLLLKVHEHLCCDIQSTIYPYDIKLINEHKIRLIYSHKIEDINDM